MPKSKPLGKPLQTGEANGVPAGDLLTSARLRGQKACAELLAAEGRPLTASQAGKILRLTPAEVDERRQAGRLLAVEGDAAGFLYPSWQFTRHGTLPGLEEVLAELQDDNPWVRLRFFLNGSFRLNGASPLQELRKGNLDEVQRAARTYGEQGAV